MKTIKEIGVAALVVALIGGLSACDSMTTRQRDTAIGGNALSTLGGAAVGGVIGNQVGK